MTNYLDIFSSSPFAPLTKHMDKVLACVQQLQPFFEAALAGDTETMGSIQKGISEQERKADRYQREVLSKLPRGVFTPVARQDLLTMLKLQDAIAYKVDDIAGRLTSRPLKLTVNPDPALAEALMAYIQQTLAVTELSNTVVNELDELITTGFGGREAQRVHERLDAIEQAEMDARELLRKLRKRIFQIEADMPTLEVLYLYRVTDRLAELNAALRQHGNQFEMMLASA